MTATDGNHGYGVAFIAQLFRCRAKVTLGKILHQFYFRYKYYSILIGEKYD